MGFTAEELEKVGLFKPPDLIRYELFAKTLSGLRDAAQAVYESKTMTPEEKREKLNQIYFGMISVARGAIGKERLKAVNE